MTRDWLQGWGLISTSTVVRPVPIVRAGEPLSQVAVAVHVFSIATRTHLIPLELQDR